MNQASIIATSIGALFVAFGITFFVTRPSDTPKPVDEVAAELPLEPLPETSPGSSPDLALDLPPSAPVPGLEEDILAELASHMRPLNDYVAAFELDPQDEEAVNGILYHVQDMPNDAVEPLLRKFLAKAPTETAFIDHLGWTILYEDKRYQDVIDFFEPLFEGTKDQNPAAAELLANAYASLGKTEKATSYARQAAATGSDPGLELQLGHFELDLSHADAAAKAFARGQQKLQDLRQARATAPGRDPGIQPGDEQLISVEVSLGIGQAKILSDQGDRPAATKVIASLERRLADLRSQAAELGPEAEGSGIKGALEGAIDRQEGAIQRSKARLGL